MEVSIILSMMNIFQYWEGGYFSLRDQIISYEIVRSSFHMYRALEIIPYFLEILPSSQARIIKKIGSMSQVIFSISPNRIVE